METRPCRRRAGCVLFALGLAACGGADVGTADATMGNAFDGMLRDLGRSDATPTGSDLGAKDFGVPGVDAAASAGDISATIDGQAYAFVSQGAAHNAGSDTTTILGANVQQQALAIGFNGHAVGTFSCPPTGPTTYVSFSTASDSFSTVSQTGASCSITVTAYGEVGGHIVGTFSATSPRTGSTGPAAAISGGSFDVIRGSDL